MASTPTSRCDDGLYLGSPVSMHSIFAGTTLSTFAYGIHFCIFVTTFYLMLNARSPNKFSKWLYVYLWVMFTLGTSQAITSALLTDKMFITHYGFPGGPVCWLAQNFNGITQIWVSSLVFIAIFLQDVMLLYRLLAVWCFKYYVAILPGLVLLVSTILWIISIVHFVQVRLGTQNVVLAKRYSLESVVVSLGFNVFSTLAIVGRMLYLRKRAIKSLGKEHARVYTGIASVFIESGALYSSVSLIYSISVATNNRIQTLVAQILFQVVCIAPELILLRAALGRAWTKETTINISQILIRDVPTERASSVNHDGSGAGSNALHSV